MKGFFTLLKAQLATSTVLLSISPAQASPPTWQEGEVIPDIGRANVLDLPEQDFKNQVTAGKLHALVYPVKVTGIILPYNPIVTIMSDTHDNPIKVMFRSLFKAFSRFKTEDDIYAWLGLPPYPAATDTGVYAVPYPGNSRPAYRMGVTIADTQWGKGFTFSCAACHSTRLFGKSVLGLSNKVSRANEFFIIGKKASSQTQPDLFQYISNATDSEMQMFKRAQDNLRYVEAVPPQVLGLDTSLAHTALALSRRANDGYATKNYWNSVFPRQEPLRNQIADSKPAPWWNVKYKNRWLLDGSVVSGNPILTNLFWNEIGRGVDLKELEVWLNNNPKIVSELTSTVFANEAPLYTDFFAAETLSLEAAQRGEVLFNSNCASCHGTYEKAWSHDEFNHAPLVERLKTVRVRYHSKTPVIDVGTDAHRYNGMPSLAAALNRLTPSKNFGVVVKAQHGYVPPPLVGIWARWPYFHNSSVPTLCDVLTRSEKRTKSFYTGEAESITEHFDVNCNGYPTGNKTPRAWKEDGNRYFNTALPGLSNSGHDEGIFLEDGVEIYTDAQKHDIIEFLKTL